MCAILPLLQWRAGLDRPPARARTTVGIQIGEEPVGRASLTPVKPAQTRQDAD